MGYDLTFISDEDLFNHVEETFLKYASEIDESKFHDNKIDPIKLTFDAKVYGINQHNVVEAETSRQIDKTNSNHIGMFNQNFFDYIEGWRSLGTGNGMDVINDDGTIVAEIKNKHNTLNSSSAESTFNKLKAYREEHPNTTCMLVEVIASRSQKIRWNYKGNTDEQIQRVSMDRFLELVTGEEDAFANFCKVLPSVLDDVVAKHGVKSVENNMAERVEDDSAYFFKNAFASYNGFQDFEFVEPATED